MKMFGFLLCILHCCCKFAWIVKFEQTKNMFSNIYFSLKNIIITINMIKLINISSISKNALIKVTICNSLKMLAGHVKFETTEPAEKKNLLLSPDLVASCFKRFVQKPMFIPEVNSANMCTHKNKLTSQRSVAFPSLSRQCPNRKAVITLRRPYNLRSMKRHQCRVMRAAESIGKSWINTIRQVNLPL